MSATLDNGLSLNVAEGSKAEFVLFMPTPHWAEPSSYLPPGMHMLELTGVSWNGGGPLSVTFWITYTDGFFSNIPMRQQDGILQADFPIYPGQPAWGRRGGIGLVQFDFVLDNRAGSSASSSSPATTAAPEVSSWMACGSGVAGIAALRARRRRERLPLTR